MMMAKGPGGGSRVYSKAAHFLSLAAPFLYENSSAPAGLAWKVDQEEEEEEEEEPLELQLSDSA